MFFVELFWTLCLFWIDLLIVSVMYGFLKI